MEEIFITKIEEEILISENSSINVTDFNLNLID